MAMADNPKGIRIQVYESDPLQWVYNLHPDAADCRQHRVSPKEWAVSKAHQDAGVKVQKLLEEISRRDEVEFEEAWNEQQERERRDG